MASRTKIIDVDRELAYLDYLVNDLVDALRDWASISQADQWTWSWEWPDAAGRLETLGREESHMTPAQVHTYERIQSRLRSVAPDLRAHDLPIPELGPPQR